ncbi:MAG TPA: fibronectin type III domain-containing protein [Nocardioides sp.]|nr:fibronectin type III domain-containing protein [Nocardioides sp.]
MGGVKPVRTIPTGTNLPLSAIANDGTIYAANGSSIDVWAADSDGSPDIVKSFTGASVDGQPALDEIRGLAYASGTSVVVIDPHQAPGAVVPTRTITGAATDLDDATAVAWAPDGSLWVFDTTSSDGPELLRFVAGATGNAAPAQRIAGPKVRLASAAVVGGQGLIAAMPDSGVAFAPATATDPQVSIFRGTQSGNVAPAYHASVATVSPHWLSEGLASDAQGRLYLGSGDIQGNYFGRLDIFSSTGRPIVTIGGSAQRFQVPLLPTVAKNGTLALVDTTVLDLGGTTQTIGQVDVYRVLFAKPGAVRSLKVTTSRTSQTVSWLAPASPGGTPPSYTVVVKQGTRTVPSKKVATTKLAVARSGLPKGSLKVTVTAVNIGGAGPGTSRTFSN